MKMELAVAEGHLCNMGRMIEELEGKLRNSLDQVIGSHKSESLKTLMCGSKGLRVVWWKTQVYFGKTREMVCTLRPPAEIVQMRLPDSWYSHLLINLLCNNISYPLTFFLFVCLILNVSPSVLCESCVNECLLLTLSRVLSWLASQLSSCDRLLP